MKPPSNCTVGEHHAALDTGHCRGSWSLTSQQLPSLLVVLLLGKAGLSPPEDRTKSPGPSSLHWFPLSRQSFLPTI